ncbi:hypothetical protein FRX31_004941 [Thalictrum thalictroides]|uniref:Uncharacterized protein n=1 Tax=Thalictrum thalictroides TaxID=46969 RepID=A0A7J6X6U5_THATH|nr:hypothetical protein FRX31_004941 [Thalictrum thalictroides]
MLRNGEFLLQYGRQKVGYYDPKSETFRPIVIQNDRRLREGYVQAVIQVGSLFSPKNLSRLTNRNTLFARVP